MDENGSPPGPERIRFGPRPVQILLPEVAEDLLKLWQERSPATFGAYLAEVLTGEKPRSVRGHEGS